MNSGRSLRELKYHLNILDIMVTIRLEPQAPLDGGLGIDGKNIRRGFIALSSDAIWAIIFRDAPRG